LHSEFVIDIRVLEQLLLLFPNLFVKLLVVVLQFLLVVKEFNQDLNAQLL